jgi:hypothetical protein
MKRPRPEDMMKRTLILLALVAGPFSAVAKDPPTAVRLAREFLTPDLWSRYLDATVAEYAAKYRSTVEKRGGTADAGLETAIRDYYAKALPYQDVLDLEASLLQKHFTEPELQELLRFWQTPLGRKMRDKMPDVQRDAMALAMQKVSLEDLGAVMRPHFHPGPAGPTASPKAGAREEDHDGDD